MIQYQIAIWIILSVCSGIVTYLVLTEGKSNYLMMMTFFLNLATATGTSYFWLLTTEGLAMFDWSLYVIPTILSFLITVLYLSYHKAYHRTRAFPRIPKWTPSRGMIVGAFAVIFLL